MSETSSHTILLKAPDIHIPGYKILRPLGEGGMASVFLAIQESLEREVALKVMAPALAANPEFSTRFISEGKITAQLNHPNLVTVYDIGSHNEINYLAAEYIPGGTLKAVMSHGLSVAAALDMTCDLARGLDYAHRKGFVHRDVKPGNILFKNDGTPVLADFGIAKAINAESGATMAGTSIGTPDYMSPEQARADKVDGRTDLYALGAMLFEILEGHRPYQADDPFTVALMHVSHPVPVLSGAHTWLQPLIDATMAKNPDDRVATGQDYVRLVEQLCMAAPEGVLLNDEGATRAMSSVHGRTSSVERARTIKMQQEAQTKPAKSNGWLWPAIAGLGILALLVGLYAAGVFGDQSNDAGSNTDKPNIIEGKPVNRPADTVSAPADEPVTQTTPKPSDNTLPSQTDRDEASSEMNDRVDALLLQAQSDLAFGLSEKTLTRRLISPPGNNALDRFRDVLKLDPNNQEAKDGIARIAGFYRDRAKHARKQKLWAALNIISADGLRIVPDDAEFKAWQKEAQQRMAQ